MALAPIEGICVGGPYDGRFLTSQHYLVRVCMTPPVSVIPHAIPEAEIAPVSFGFYKLQEQPVGLRRGKIEWAKYWHWYPPEGDSNALCHPGAPRATA